MEPKDHDLLIELRAEVKGLRDDVRTLNSDTSGRIAELQRGKLDKEAFMSFMAQDQTEKKDHESRIRSLEQAFWKAIGALAVIQFVGQYIISKFL